MAQPTVTDGDRQISIRRCCPADQPQLEILLAAFLGHQHGLPPGVAESLGDVLRSGAHLAFIAEDASAPVGFITASTRRVARYPGPITEVDELYVAPSARGRGTGRMLVDALKEAARTGGCQRLFVASNLSRQDAHRFYQALGFDAYGGHFRTNLA